MDWINSLSSFGGYAAIAGILLIMQYKQDEWIREYMEELRNSIERLADAIEKGEKKKREQHNRPRKTNTMC